MDWLTSAAAAAASLQTIGGFAVALVVFAIPRLRRVPQHVEEWVIGKREERLARIAREKQLAALIGYLPDIRAQLHPNGGHSLRDRVDSAHELAEAGVAAAGSVERKLDQHIEDSTRDRGDIKRRLGALEGAGGER